ncbi:MAG TPA: alpha/beta hydrolase [Thermodesulfobacteriota bacterium]|nr:alpha/beta hydrolase [Thermodesulfobacteriota bacterium]
MEHVTSKDGVPIAYERCGQGPPLVLVHGSAADHTRWRPILQKMRKHFTVYAIDRRGRGQSGDAEPYAIEHEYEDVATTVDSIPGPVNLLGHSFGALCALEASLKTPNLRKLILYEPPISTPIKKNYPPDAMDRIHSYLHIGEGEKALLIFLREIVGIPTSEMNRLRSMPGWPLRVATAHTIPREEASVDSYLFNPERFSHMEIPTLLLLGGESPPFYSAAIETLKRSLPHSRIATMPGQRHAAMDTAPELFLREVIEFLTEKR